jgi:HEPN domain-containing protein
MSLPPEGLVRQWLQIARSDLAFAEMAPPPGAMYEQLCFHAQQAVEKALKGLLLQLAGHDAPKIHDIASLLDLMAKHIAYPPDLADAAALTVYAVITRYPPFDTPLTEQHWQSATRTARRVFEWVELQLATPPEPNR